MSSKSSTHTRPSHRFVQSQDSEDVPYVGGSEGDPPRKVPPAITQLGDDLEEEDFAAIHISRPPHSPLYNFSQRTLRPMETVEEEDGEKLWYLSDHESETFQEADDEYGDVVPIEVKDCETVTLEEEPPVPPHKKGKKRNLVPNRDSEDPDEAMREICRITESTELFPVLSNAYSVHTQRGRYPPLRFHLVSPGKGKRPYFFLRVPPVGKKSKECCLCCRMKSNQPIIRFSTNPSKLRRKGNPDYVGKIRFVSMTDFGTFRIVLSNDVMALRGEIIQTKQGRQMNIELSTFYPNAKEEGLKGNRFSGSIHSYVQPIFSLAVEKNDRVVLVLQREREVHQHDNER